MTDKKFQKGFEYVKKMHKGQFRAGKAPVWQHLLRVSTILKTALEITREGTPAGREVIFLSALGHDLFEDTKSKEKDIKNIFGRRGLELIQGMTNSWGDEEKPLYIKKVCSSEEGVRLIKLADLLDNYSSVSITLGLLGVKWTSSYFLPIVVPMKNAIIKTKFKKYRKTSQILISQIETASHNLEALLGNL